MIRTATGGLVTTLSVALLAVAPASAAHAAAPAALDALDVSVVTANGSGCPSSGATAQALDSSSFTVDTASFYAWSGDSAPTTDFRKNCQIALQITQPAGWTYAVESADYSGYALLGDDVTGLQAAHYYFQGSSDTASASHSFAGPFAGSWNTSDAPDSQVFAPCDAERNLNINTEVRVTAGTTGLNWMYQDPSFTVHLTWQACA
jgi:hypothetical protein